MLLNCMFSFKSLLSVNLMKSFPSFNKIENRKLKRKFSNKNLYRWCEFRFTENIFKTSSFLLVPQ